MTKKKQVLDLFVCIKNKQIPYLHKHSAAEKHPHGMMLPTPCFTVGMVPSFLQMRRLAFRPNSLILVFIRPENLVSFWQTPSGLSCAFF
jgi:hypothetical protein